MSPGDPSLYRLILELGGSGEREGSEATCGCHEDLGRGNGFALEYSPPAEAAELVFVRAVGIEEGVYDDGVSPGYRSADGHSAPELDMCVPINTYVRFRALREMKANSHTKPHRNFRDDGYGSVAAAQANRIMPTTKTTESSAVAPRDSKTCGSKIVVSTWSTITARAGMYKSAIDSASGAVVELDFSVVHRSDTRAPAAIGRSVSRPRVVVVVGGGARKKEKVRARVASAGVTRMRSSSSIFVWQLTARLLLHVLARTRA